ncbi:GNAT family N-acetyltransferase [Streptomyces sp. NPDC048290]|uniref:GNAT family N-acetyltransferase n=1 Tax=Streptomyces sp. NPDC048290 TaxID=3155811 RepID=UPI00342BAAAF
MSESGYAESGYAHRRAVHQEAVDGFGTVRVLPLDPERDAPAVHGWVSAERAVFWGMTGVDRRGVTEIYAHMESLDTHHAYLVVKDNTPVALFQTYEPDADRVGACYEVRPGDIGVHLLVAPAGPGGVRPGWGAALMSVLLGFALLTLDRQRIVVDPDTRNQKALARMVRSGFTPGPVVLLPEIDLPDVYLPEKRAQLAFLERRTAFPEAAAQAPARR